MATPQPPGALPIIVHLVPAPAHFQTGRTEPIRYIVLHNTEGEDSRAWLSTAPTNKESIHVLVGRDGTRTNIVQYGDTAYHVGIARPPYRNANCLGIEWENRSNHYGRSEAYADEAIATGAYTVATWMFSYGLGWDQVVRHGDIASPPGRRWDPSNFPLMAFMARVDTWLRFFRQLTPAEHAAFIR